MQRLRSTWMALMGGILLVTLSISAAFGAPPPATEDGPKGLSVAAFVHGLLFDGEAPESDPEETQDEEEEENFEDELDDEADLEEEDVDEEEVDEEEVETEQHESAAHGACVSEVAHDKAGENDPDDADYANHGERVSEAARVLCWETDEEVVEEEVEEVETEQHESDAHGACVSEVAHDKAGENDPDDADYANHGERVSEAARFLCWGVEVGTDEEQEVEESDTGSTTGGPGQSGQANGHGKANAPGQQKTQAGGGGGRPDWAGRGGGPGGRGR